MLPSLELMQYSLPLAGRYAGLEHLYQRSQQLLLPVQPIVALLPRLHTNTPDSHS